MEKIKGTWFLFLSTLLCTSIFLSACVSFDLTLPEVDPEIPSSTVSEEAEPAAPPAPFNFTTSTPTPNRMPDSKCYLYQGEICVEPVIESSSLVPTDEANLIAPPPDAGCGLYNDGGMCLAPIVSPVILPSPTIEPSPGELPKTGSSAGEFMIPPPAPVYESQ